MVEGVSSDASTFSINCINVKGSFTSKASSLLTLGFVIDRATSGNPFIISPIKYIYYSNKDRLLNSVSVIILSKILLFPSKLLRGVLKLNRVCGLTKSIIPSTIVPSI